MFSDENAMQRERSTTMKSAIICARVSNDDPNSERLDDQLAECRKWAEDHGYTVVGEVVENGVSGGKPIRQRAPAHRALEQLRAGQVNVVIWREIDRMGRRFDTAETIEEYQRYGDGIVFVRQPRPDDPIAEILQRGMGAVLARWERANIYQRTAQGRNRKAREGKPIIGTLPRWLRWDEAQGVVLVEDEARKLVAILKDYGRLGLNTLAEKYELHPTSLHLMLSNPGVAGRRYVFPLLANPPLKTDQQRRRRAAMREISLAPTIEEADAIAERYGLVRQEVPALVTWERFHEIQTRLLKMSGSQRGRPPKHPLPLQKRVRCGRHGLTYTPARTGSSGYVYAECSAHRGYQAHKYGRCDYPRFPWTRDTKRGRALVSLVEEALHDALASPEALERAARESEAYLVSQVDQLRARTGNVDEELGKLRAKKEKLALLWMDGDLPDARWQREKVKLDRAIRDLENRAAMLEEDRRQLRFYQAQLELIRKLPDVRVTVGAALPGFDDLDRMAEYLDLQIIVEADKLRLLGLIPIADVTFKPEEGEPVDCVKSAKSS